MGHRILLAFSGGLDTSFCVIHLKEQGHEVHTVTVDTGGFPPAELARIEDLAKRLGSASHTTIDARQELFYDYLRFLIAGNVLRGGLYPLSVSAERVCQAKRVVAHARTIKATSLAHGSTGAGNDQVRFDVAFRTLAPDLALLAPIRELAPSRADERAFLEALEEVPVMSAAHAWVCFVPLPGRGPGWAPWPSTGPGRILAERGSEALHTTPAGGRSVDAP